MTTVAAVVVTFNRRDVLRSTLEAVADQARRPDAVVVVDNASEDGTEAMLEGAFPWAAYLRMPENLGFAAGLGAGMRWALDEGHGYVWLLDDDSRPGAQALRRSLEVAKRVDRLGAVGSSGGMLSRGVPDRRPERRHPFRLDGEGRLYRCDFLLLDGALIPAEAIRAVGLPRGDFFMGYEDVEYTSRLSGAGLRVLLLDEDLIDRAHLGSGGAVGNGSSPPWRAYYQTRNHLLTALDRGGPSEILGWALRQGRLIVGTLLHGDRKLAKIRLRALGAWHGARGITGRTIEPGS